MWELGTHDYHKMTRYFLREFRRDLNAFCWARMDTIRSLMRMRPQARKELDDAVNLVLTQVPDRKAMVAIHIRRGDKVASGEAKAVQTGNFVQACLAAGRANASSVIVLSDDEKAGAEFRQSWIELGGSNFTKIVSRTAIFRPDQSKHAVNDARKGFWWLMTDLRIMVQADTFVGSQSSNLGAIVSAMRGWYRCWSVGFFVPFFRTSISIICPCF